MIDDHKKIDKKIEAAHVGAKDDAAPAKDIAKDSAKEKFEKEYTNELENFSVSLSDKHYTKAVQLRQQLIDMGTEEPKF